MSPHHYTIYPKQHSRHNWMNFCQLSRAAFLLFLIMSSSLQNHVSGTTRGPDNTLTEDRRRREREVAGWLYYMDNVDLKHL